MDIFVYRITYRQEDGDKKTEELVFDTMDNALAQLNIDLVEIKKIYNEKYGNDEDAGYMVDELSVNSKEATAVIWSDSDVRDFVSFHIVKKQLNHITGRKKIYGRIRNY